MILDAPAPDRKSTSDPSVIISSNSETTSPFSAHSANYNSSYSTFPSNQAPSSYHHTGASTSDTSQLLGRHAPNELEPDSELPSYNDIYASEENRSPRKRIWVYYLVYICSLLVVIGVYLWIQYPVSGRHGVPPSSPSKFPFILPTTGRTDLCRPWANQLNTSANSLSKKPGSSNRLVYDIPTLAPIHLEAIALCPSPNGGSTQCPHYEEPGNAIAGNLRVIDTDVELPSVEIYVEQGSSYDFDNIAICLTPQRTYGKINRQEPTWVIGFYIWKLEGRGPSQTLASFSVKLLLPRRHAHNLSTNLAYFTQTIGQTEKADEDMPTFQSISLAGDFGRMEVQNLLTNSVTIRSETSNIMVKNVQVTELIDLRSDLGTIECNATLVNNVGKPEPRVNLEAPKGEIAGIFTLHYPLDSLRTPHFQVRAASGFSRTTVWVVDPQGAQVLKQHQTPLPTLPAIHLNISSYSAISQAVLPPTFYGTLNLRTQQANIVTNDRAGDIPGRSLTWFEHSHGTRKGDVIWKGREHSEKGSVYMSTDLAVLRMLFLGLEQEEFEGWPTEGNDTS